MVVDIHKAEIHRHISHDKRTSVCVSVSLLFPSVSRSFIPPWQPLKDARLHAGAETLTEILDGASCRDPYEALYGLHGSLRNC